MFLCLPSYFQAILLHPFLKKPLSSLRFTLFQRYPPHPSKITAHFPFYSLMEEPGLFLLLPGVYSHSHNPQRFYNTLGSQFPSLLLPDDSLHSSTGSQGHGECLAFHPHKFITSAMVCPIPLRDKLHPLLSLAAEASGSSFCF